MSLMERQGGGRVPRYLSEPSQRMLGISARTWMWVFVLSGAVVEEAVTRLGVVGAFVLVPVSTMISTAARELARPEFLFNSFLPTILLILASFGCSVVFGIFIAYWMWRWRGLDQALSPYLNLYYAVPTFALYPLIVAVLGLGYGPVLLLGFLFSIVVVIVSALNGFRTVPPVVGKLSSSLRLSKRQYLVRVLLPAAIPDIVVGSRLALAYSFIGIIATEFILSTQGLGHYISFAYDNFQMADMYAGVLLICVVALLLNGLISLVTRPLDWKRRDRG